VELLMMSDDARLMNIGNPGEVTMNQLAGESIALTKSTSRIVHTELPEDDPKVRKPDVSLARSILGWEPKTGREEGLKRTIEYIRIKGVLNDT
jgi:dTDP-glucose 4,6-dehydratase